MTLWGHGRRAPGRWGTGSPRRPPPPGPGRTRRWTRLSPRPRARMSRRSRARRPQLRACLARRRAPGWRATWAGRRRGPSCAISGWAGWARTAAAAAPAACPALRRPRPAARPATAPRLRRSLTFRPEPGRAASGEGSTAGRRRCTAPSVQRAAQRTTRSCALCTKTALHGSGERPPCLTGQPSHANRRRPVPVKGL